MADRMNDKPIPPPSNKGKTMERVERGMKAEKTGGDSYDRSMNRYAKKQTPRDDPFEGL